MGTVGKGEGGGGGGWGGVFFFFQAEDGIRDDLVTGVQTCALPICAIGGVFLWAGCRKRTKTQPRLVTLTTVKLVLKLLLILNYHTHKTSIAI